MEEKPVEYKLPDGKPPDWTISELYNKAFEIVKKNKVLWVFGAAVAAFAGGGITSNLNSFVRVSEKFNLQQYFQTQPSSNQISQALGTTTSSAPPVLIPIVFGLSANIPAYLWILLGSEILVLAAISIIISLISNAWANASILQAIQSALSGKNVSITDSSQKAFSSVRPLIWLSSIPGLIFWFTTIAAFGVIAIGFVWGGQPGKILSIVLLIVAIPAMIYFSIQLLLTNIWAQRRIVLDNKPWKESFWAGYRIARKKKWAMLLLGLVNTILTTLVIGIPVATIAGLFLGGIYSIERNNLAIILFILGGLLLVAFVISSQLLGGILTAFKAAVWTIAYTKTRGKYEKN